MQTKITNEGAYAGFFNLESFFVIQCNYKVLNAVNITCHTSPEILEVIPSNYVIAVFRVKPKRNMAVIATGELTILDNDLYERASL